MAWHDNELWADLDALADSYENVHGVRPDRMRIGLGVAESLEGPREDGHPLHQHWASPTPGVWFPAQPERESWWAQRTRERRCRRETGGHWWHPADPMIAWFCCVCGKDTDGMPQDGSRG